MQNINNSISWGLRWLNSRSHSLIHRHHMSLVLTRCGSKLVHRPSSIEPYALRGSQGAQSQVPGFQGEQQKLLPLTTKWFSQIAPRMGKYIKWTRIRFKVHSFYNGWEGQLPSTSTSRILHSKNRLKAKEPLKEFCMKQVNRFSQISIEYSGVSRWMTATIRINSIGPPKPEHNNRRLKNL